MMISYTLRGLIDAPEGSKLNETRSGILLPNGETLKLWESWEVNIDDENHRNLEYTEMVERQLFYAGEMIEFEITE